MSEKLTNEQKAVQIPYFLHEGEMERAEIRHKEESAHLIDTNKRQFILILIVLFLFVSSNLAWIIHENQYEDQMISYEVSQDSGVGGQNTFANNVIRLIGGEDNGKASDQSYHPAAGEEDAGQQSENVPDV